MKRIVIIAIAAFLAVANALAEEGVWIRYPGDYEMWLGSDVQSRRIEHGMHCGVREFYGGGWMKNPGEVITCCNDGLRPVYFKLEATNEEAGPFLGK